MSVITVKYKSNTITVNCLEIVLCWNYVTAQDSFDGEERSIKVQMLGVVRKHKNIKYKILLLTDK